jgi:hypothetical protein
MDYLTSLFRRITRFFSGEQNLKLVGEYHHKPTPPVINQEAIESHQRTLRVAFKQHLFAHEINYITSETRRSTIDPDSILADFFAGDVDPCPEPTDPRHKICLELALDCMEDAFSPPRKAKPVHLHDVEHHYPFKWNVNAEAPFSTDTYFLENRKPYADYYDKETHKWTHYVNPAALEKRFGPDPTPSQLSTLTPAKFGFMKSTVFAWTRRWHHVIKSGFQDPTGLENTPYFKQRFIFPMLLHSKTAIVKRNDPNKMRTIWGCSKPWIIADAIFYWELQAWMKLNPGCTPILWGYETFTGGWLRLNAALFNGYVRNSFLTIDWRRFDKRAYFWLIRLIMYRIRNTIDLSNGYVPTYAYPDYPNWAVGDHEQRLQRLWEWTLENLFNSNIVTPDGKMYSRDYAGIPSGLFITQLLDTWYNYTKLAFLLLLMDMNPRDCIIKVQGDDSVIRLAVLIPPSEHTTFLETMANLAETVLKASLSFEKSELRNDLNGVEVLSYRNLNGMPFRDEIAMLAIFYHTKAKNPTPPVTMAAAAGFAYASIGNNRRVYDCLKSIYNYYAEQGYTPLASAGANIVFGDSPDRPWLPFTLDHFPSISEIKQYMTSYTYRNPEQDRRTWPMTHFILPPCA